MSVITWDTAGGGGRMRINVKGAPEAILRRCVLPEDERAAVLAAADRLARRGLRVLAIAARELP
ncbi:hypothetical protein AB0J43_48710, partial [Nonomuraea fuscirosea]